MNNEDIRRIAAVKNELGSSLPLFMNEDMGKQLAYCSQTVLARVLTNLKVLPKLQQTAIRQLSELIETPEPGVGQGIPAGKSAGSLRACLAQAAPDFAQISAAAQEVVRELLGGSEHGNEQWARQIVEIDLDMRRADRNAYELELQGAQGEKQEEYNLSAGQIEALGNCLRQRFTHATDLTVAEVKTVPGGYSKRTISIYLENPGTVPASLIARVDNPESPIATSVTQEYPIVAECHRLGVPVPNPVALVTDKSILGAPFMLMERVAGEVPGDFWGPKNQDPHIAESLARVLAKLHGLNPAGFGDPPSAEAVADRVLQEIDECQSTWKKLSVSNIPVEAAFAWLRNNIELASGPVSLIHRDAAFHNILANEGKVTALLDWEMATFGTAAEDLGYVYASAIQSIPWDSFLDAYQEPSTSIPSREQIDFYRLWADLRITTLVVQVSVAFLGGKSQSIQFGFTDANNFPRLLLRMSELLSMLLNPAGNKTSAPG